jgi:hypothetical protein
MMRSQPKLAAAAGLAYVGTLVTFAIIAEIKDFEHISDFIGSSNEMFGSLGILAVFSSVFFLWFAATAAERFRQVEMSYGGSGRLSRAMYGSAVIIAGVIVLEVAVQWAARTGGADLGALANALIEGPALAAPVIVFLGAGGLITVRAEGLAPPSPVLGRLAIATSAAFGVLAGLQLFKNYAWINETTYLTFAAWILVMSIIGISRWGALDSDASVAPVRSSVAPVRSSAASAVPVEAVATPARKPAARKRKPAARKSTAKRTP